MISGMDQALEKQAELLRGMVAESRAIVVFTGAGISTESGISDYRSKGGIYQNFRPVTLHEIMHDESRRVEYWREKKEMYGQMRKAGPGPGHRAIAALEKTGCLKGVITQNIDGLHKKAGSSRVVEIHGTNLEAVCLECRDIMDFEIVYERLLEGEEQPRCLKCRGLLKPNTISFGQNLDPDVLTLAFALAKKCDLMICAGSSLVVEPAASLPVAARQAGARVVIINRDATPLDGIADLVVRTTIGPFLSAVAG